VRRDFPLRVLCHVRRSPWACLSGGARIAVAAVAINNALADGHQYDGGDGAIKQDMSMVLSERRSCPSAACGIQV